LFAGPVEFSAAEIVGALVVLLLVYVILPVIGGWLALRRYRRSRSEEERTTAGAFGSFAMGVIAASLLIGVVAWLSEALIA
jgi:hypothetical protein